MSCSAVSGEVVQKRSMLKSPKGHAAAETGQLHVGQLVHAHDHATNCRAGEVGCSQLCCDTEGWCSRLVICTHGPHQPSRQGGRGGGAAEAGRDRPGDAPTCSGR